MKDFIKRHSTWFFIAIILIIIGIFVFREKSVLDLRVNTLITQADSANIDYMYPAIQSIQAKSDMISPIKVLIEAVILFLLAIPLSGIVLFSYTNIPFLKFLLKGKDNQINDEERFHIYGIIKIVFIMAVFIMAVALILINI